MNIIITIPKSIKWSEYQKEIDKVKDGNHWMLYHIPFKPKYDLKGGKCFLCYNGFIVGFMIIINVFYSDGFMCDTTGARWPEGWYVCRTGNFYPLMNPVPMKGFRGIRYVDNELAKKLEPLICDFPDDPVMNYTYYALNK